MDNSDISFVLPVLGFMFKVLKNKFNRCWNVLPRHFDVVLKIEFLVFV